MNHHHAWDEQLDSHHTDTGKTGSVLETGKDVRKTSLIPLLMVRAVLVRWTAAAASVGVLCDGISPPQKSRSLGWKNLLLMLIRSR
jgi:hypothetical protein